MDCFRIHVHVHVHVLVLVHVHAHAHALGQGHRHRNGHEHGQRHGYGDGHGQWHRGADRDSVSVTDMITDTDTDTDWDADTDTDMGSQNFFNMPESRNFRYLPNPLPEWKKANDPGTSLVPGRGDAVPLFLVRYPTETMDAGMRMPALLFLMPMPSYGKKYLTGFNLFLTIHKTYFL